MAKLERNDLDTNTRRQGKGGRVNKLLCENASIKAILACPCLEAGPTASRHGQTKIVQ